MLPDIYKVIMDVIYLDILEYDMNLCDIKGL